MTAKYPDSFDCGLSFIDNDELNKEVNIILNKIKQEQEEKEIGGIKARFKFKKNPS